jgi:glutamate racemase
MPDEKERYDVFNSALESMVKWCGPDIIFIACNTLSMIYPETPFAKHANLDVLGIVDFGVDLVYESLSGEKGSAAVLLGTPTTINSGVHKQKLLDRGIDSARIVEQPCYMLESEIQDNPASDATRNLVKQYIAESRDKFNVSYDKIYAALCCTHYAYSIKIFAEELKNIFSCPVEILNPNSSMAAYFNMDAGSKSDLPAINCEVVSRVPILDEEIGILGALLKTTSPKVCESLTNFHQITDLF